MRIPVRTVEVQFMRDNPGRFIESNTENSWLRYLNNMSIQGTWADALIIQTVADALNVTIQMVESNQGFAPLTTVYPVQERNTLSAITIGHIDECHYVSTTALQSNAPISMCNELMNDTQSSRNTHFIISTYRVRTLFQTQISRTFPGLGLIFQGSKIHINFYTPKISMLILLTAFHTLHIFS